MKTLVSDQEHMEAVWRQRAARLSLRALADSASQDELQVIVVVVGDERYGIELPDVAEVLPPVRLTPVPGAPPIFSGVINVHGEIRPVIDLKRLLGIEAVENGDPARVILLRWQGRELGLKVDRVEHIRKVACADLQSTDNRDTDLSARYLRGLTRDALMLLSTEALFRELFKGAKL
jgi:chemotaxis signal transduction protein